MKVIFDLSKWGFDVITLDITEGLIIDALDEFYETFTYEFLKPSSFMTADKAEWYNLAVVNAVLYMHDRDGCKDKTDPIMIIWGLDYLCLLHAADLIILKYAKFLPNAHVPFSVERIMVQYFDIRLLLEIIASGLHFTYWSMNYLEAGSKGTKMAPGVDDDVLFRASKFATFTKINASQNPEIGNYEFYSAHPDAPIIQTLVELKINVTSGFDDRTLSMFKHLTLLHANHNIRISRIGSFASNLIELSSVSGRISDQQLMDAHSLKRLFCTDNVFIQSIAPFAETLVELHASHTTRNVSGYGVSDATLSRAPNLKILDVSGNRSITRLDWCIDSLEELNAAYSGLTDGTFAHIDRSRIRIRRLNISNNPHITTLLPFPMLEDLKAAAMCELTNESLRDVPKLVKLNIARNEKITSILHCAETLEHLIANDSNLTNEGLRHAKSLRILNVSDAEYITEFSDSVKRTLEELNLEGLYTCVTSDALTDMDNLKKLNLSSNVCVNNLRSLTGLEELNVSFSSVMRDRGLRNLHCLRHLNAESNSYITTVEPFAKTLKYLNASGSGIENEGLQHAQYIETLIAYNTPNITAIESFAKTLLVLHAQHPSGLTNEALKHAINLVSVSYAGNQRIRRPEREFRKSPI